TAALNDVGITEETADPVGGKFHRDADGQATGFVDETAFHGIVGPFLDELVDVSASASNLDRVQAAYRQTGVTTSCDMGFNEADLETFLAADRTGRLTSRLKANWRRHKIGDREQD